MDSNYNVPGINNLSGSLTDFYNNFKKYTTSDVTEHQKDMIKIVETEKERLDKKREVIDTAYNGKQRSNQLNESFRLKYNDYIKIIKIIILILILVIIILFFSKNFKNISPHVFEILIMIVVSFGIISLYYSIRDISIRNNTNYNELKLSPLISENNVVNDYTNNKNNILYNLEQAIINNNLCITEDCCDAGTKWNEEKGMCSVDPKSTPTIENFEIMNEIFKPYYFSETNNYSFI